MGGLSISAMGERTQSAITFKEKPEYQTRSGDAPLRTTSSDLGKSHKMHAAEQLTRLVLLRKFSTESPRTFGSPLAKARNVPLCYIGVEGGLACCVAFRGCPNDRNSR